MDTVRAGVIGLGVMGRGYAERFARGAVRGAALAAVCDHNAGKRAGLDGGVAQFEEAAELIRSATVDAVVIATPHPSHAEAAIAALKRGLHVLVEKPVAVHKAEAQRMIRAHARRKKQVFAAMFNQRTDPAYRRMREIVRGGELGDLRRVNWIITDWFRTDAYYRSNDWRATWRGEGGGVLMNQCPHNLDLLTWIVGRPSRVRGFCGFGRHHEIEVEDDVTAYLEFPGGVTGVFVTTTGEAPGTNRLEIAGTRGKLVFENNTLSFTRNAVPSDEFARTDGGLFSRPEASTENTPFPDRGPQHDGILQNFIDAIREGAGLVAPAAEGIHSLEIANAIILSSLTGRTVDLPLDGAAYERKLRALMKGGRP